MTSSQPFKFSKDALAQIKKLIAQYPKGRQESAILPILDLAQRQNDGWLSREVLEAVATLLDMPVIRVWEIASFYTLFNLQPIGKYHVQVCRTTPCWLRGSDGILETCKKQMGVQVGETSPDGLFTLSEVECLGACVNAPMLQINDDYYEDLTPEMTEALIEKLRTGDKNA